MEQQIITGTVEIQLSDADLMDIARAVGVDVDALLAAHGDYNEEQP